jgi:hypothetical protein
VLVVIQASIKSDKDQSQAGARDADCDSAEPENHGVVLVLMVFDPRWVKHCTTPGATSSQAAFSEPHIDRAAARILSCAVGAGAGAASSDGPNAPSAKASSKVMAMVAFMASVLLRGLPTRLHPHHETG